MITLNHYIFPTSFIFFSAFFEDLKKEAIQMKFELRVDEYLGYYADLHYVCFLTCGITILLITVLKGYSFRIDKKRHVVYSTLVVLSTLLTPPSICSQLGTTFFLTIVYETCIFANILLIQLERQPIKTN